MSNYEWNHFQKLIRLYSDEQYIFIENENNQILKMSKGSYKESADMVFIKAYGLIGKNIYARTSQNTRKWPADIWFSEVGLKPFYGESNV